MKEIRLHEHKSGVSSRIGYENKQEQIARYKSQMLKKQMPKCWKNILMLMIKMLDNHVKKSLF